MVPSETGEGKASSIGAIMSLREQPGLKLTRIRHGNAHLKSSTLEAKGANL